MLDIEVTERGIRSGGRPRRYLMAGPAGVRCGELPVVVDLHGSGITPEDYFRITHGPWLAERALVVVPQAWTPFDILGALPYEVNATLPPATAWNVPGTPLPGEAAPRVGADGVDEIAFLGDLLDDLAECHGVDRRRIHVRGYSGGARLASHLAAAVPSRLASVCCVAGVRFPDRLAPEMPPLLAVHGLRDALNPFAGGTKPHWLESVPDVVAQWAAHSGCTETREVWAPHGAVETRHVRPDGTCPVRLVVLSETEHSWPGTEERHHAAIFGAPGAVSATRIHWDFVAEVESAMSRRWPRSSSAPRRSLIVEGRDEGDRHPAHGLRRC